MSCNWGDIYEEDSETNNNSVICGDRILAAYTYEKSCTTIWICTESDRSVTTILFPDEY